MNVRTDRFLVRASGGSRRYVLITFTAPVFPPRDGRVPINVALVLDRSGSMSGEKIVLVREAVRKALTMLRPEDRLSLVVYDDRIDVLVGSTPATSEAKRNAERLLAGIGARHGTDLGGGWLAGCEQVALHADAPFTSRCLLLTDGLANQGITDHDVLERHSEELRRRQVVTSTFGVGADFDERLLQRMAAAGGGHSYYIEHNVQILDYLTSELGEALEVVAHDAALELVLPPAVQAAPLNAYKHACDAGTMRVSLGDIVSGQEMSIVLKLDFPEGKEGDEFSAEFCLSDRERVLNAPPIALVWKSVDNQANDNQPRDREVDGAAAELYAARAREEALELNRAGRYDEARNVLRRTAKRIGEYANGDPILQGIVSSLQEEMPDYSTPMASSQMKSRFYTSRSVLLSRTSDGKAKRKP